MRQGQLQEYRRDLVPKAHGRVLEIGIGSGLNLPLYSVETEAILGLDPSEQLLAMAHRRATGIRVPTELIVGSASQLPVEDAAIDTIVMTWTLCSIADPITALREMRRVLKPGGALLFVEHGLSPDPKVERWQHRLTPVWRQIAGGCHLDRKVDVLIRTAGFEISDLTTEYGEGPRSMAYMYQGRALRK